MRQNKARTVTFSESNGGRKPRAKLRNFLNCNQGMTSMNNEEDDLESRYSNISPASPGDHSDQNPLSSEGSPYLMSPWNQPSPYSKSPWLVSPVVPLDNFAGNGLIGSLVREEGHVYSLAASGELMYTGSDSKNIRVWKNRKEFSGFKSNSGLVKAIIISRGKIFTGHQDGKIRIWRVSSRNPSVHKRVGTLPKFKDFLKSSINPSNYVEVRRHRNSVWLRHFDAISCLSLNEDQGLLYSGSWDKTVKVWRISDSKCLESINAHDDAINSVVSSSDGLVFTGSADGTVKMWRRELNGKTTKHYLVQTLLKLECAVTALAVSRSGFVLYCGSSDGLVNFWVRDKQFSHGGVLRGHKLAVLCLAAGGPLVFTGSTDKTISVWRRDGMAHTLLSVLNGHAGPVKCLAVEENRETASFDGKRWIVYSGSLDRSVKVWKVSEELPVPQQEYETESHVLQSYRRPGRR